MNYTEYKKDKPHKVYQTQHIETAERLTPIAVAVAYTSGRKITETFASEDEADQFLALLSASSEPPKTPTKKRGTK